MKKPKKKPKLSNSLWYRIRLGAKSCLDFFRSIFFKMSQWSIIKHILIFYLLITTIGGLLLWSGWAQQHNNVSFIDSLFTSASAFSDTGLVTKVTAATWTIFGQAVIATLILLGGIGFFSLKVYIFNLIFNRPISMFSQYIVKAERGTSQVGSTRDLIKISISIMLSLVLISSIIMMFYFYYVPGDFTYQGEGANTLGTRWTDTDQMYNPLHNWSRSIRFGIFHSISALNNAGFDIMGHHSIAPYYSGYFLQSMFMTLFVLGGIGYPVIFDVYQYFKHKLTKNPEPFRFSLFTKISCITYVLISIIGIALAFTFELTLATQYSDGSPRPTFWDDPNNGSDFAKSFAIIFNTMSTRNAGFASTDMVNFSKQTLMIQALMMFIGSAPSSTAGGIRTTTFAITLMGLWKHITNKKSVLTRNRKIPNETVHRSYAVVITSVILVLISVIILSTSFTNMDGSLDPNKFGFIDLFYEACSAFGTTGLSVGVTTHLNNFSKISMILLMFIGQLGVSSTLLVWGNKTPKSREIRFIREDVQIG